MNRIKAGDLCYIAGSPVRGVNGHVVTAVRPLLGFGGPHWEISPVIDGHWWGCAEERLFPIRPHGDDEQDESHRYLPPVPRTVTPTKEHAQ